MQESERFLAVCAGQLQPVRRTDVRTTPRHPAKRSLLELMRPETAAAAGFERTELIIGTGEHECYTPGIPGADTRFLPEIFDRKRKKTYICFPYIK